MPENDGENAVPIDERWASDAPEFIVEKAKKPKRTKLPTKVGEVPPSSPQGTGIIEERPRSK